MRQGKINIKDFMTFTFILLSKYNIFKTTALPVTLLNVNEER